MAERKSGSGRTTTTKRNTSGTRSSATRSAGSRASGSGTRSGSGASSKRSAASGYSGSRSAASRGTAGSNRSRQRSSSRSSSGNYSSGSYNYRSKRRKMEEEQMHRDITILLVFVGMLFLFLSNFGILGPAGNTFRDVMTGLFGFTAYLMPVFVFVCVIYGMMSKSSETGMRLGCSFAVYTLFGIICELISGDLAHTEIYSFSGIWERCSAGHNGGGVIFGSITYLLYKTLKMPGTILVIAAVSVIVFVLLTKESIVDMVMGAAGSARDTVIRKKDEHYDNAQRRREYYEEEDYEDGGNDEPFEDLEDERRQMKGKRGTVRYPERAADEGFIKGIVGDTTLNREDYEPEAADQGYDSYDHSSKLPDPEEAYDFYEEHGEDIKDDTEKLNSTKGYFQGYDDSKSVIVNKTDRSEDLPESLTVTLTDNSIDNSTDNLTDNLTDNKTVDINSASNIRAPRYSVAEQIIKEAQSGTDGIDLSTGPDDPFDKEEPGYADAFYAEKKSPIPIHRESNNLHEINVKDFAESSYASLSQGLYPDDEDEDELTQRIIRDGLIALGEGAAGKNVFDAAEGISIAANAGSAPSAAKDAVFASVVYENGIREAAFGTNDEPSVFVVSDPDDNAQSTDADHYDHSNDIVEITNENEGDSEYYYGDETTPAENGFASPEVTEISGIDEKISVPVDAPLKGSEYAEHIAGEYVSHEPEKERPLTEEYVSHEPEKERPLTEEYVSHELEEERPLTEEYVSHEPEEEKPLTEEYVSHEPEEERPFAGEYVSQTPANDKPMAGEHVSQAAMQHAKEAAIHTENSRPQRTDNTVVSNIDGVKVIDKRAEHVPAAPLKKKPYVYPPLELLSPGKPAADADSDEELRHTAEVLETTLHTFGVSCKITDISQGPAVTRYELLPQVGVKVSKVVSLADDIKLALAATDIRIEAPIPGKSAIGIEVPNKVTSLVALHDVLCTDEFRSFKSKLAFGVGKDISGQIVVTDLAKMPHVLIAGATGSGKSVCINTIIMSILYHSSPEEVKLLMIDPKVVELSVYNGIPHLLYPVVTNPQKAAALLNYAVAEMDQRYRMFAECGVRDIKGYNALIAAKAAQGATEDEAGVTLRQMPRLVVIVDELADLMMVAKNDVETAICRLAQLARAAGIHLIIATQRPSVDVITGLIRANMPSRIAFAVTSGTDSRIILDMNGAEKLLGKGDMLFFPQGLPKPARIQGAFVDDDEVSDVVAFIKENNHFDNDNNEVEMKMASLVNGEGSGSGLIDGGSQGPDIDDLFKRAGKFIIEKNSASIGLLQRGFRIGFNRAARIMDQLCDAGVVAESEGTKPRKILMTIAEFDSYCQDNDL